MTNAKFYTILTVLIHVVQWGGKMMNIDYNDRKSLYEQIVSGIKEQIVSGVYSAKQQLPSVRELSLSITINPNTVQKAYRQLEAEGYIYSVKGKGCFVAQATDITDESKINGLLGNLETTVKELKYLNSSKEKIISIINDIFRED